MITNLQNFHFIHPLWLLALFPIAGLLWFIFTHKVTDHAWSKVIDTPLLPLLLKQGNNTQQSQQALWLLASGWLIGVIALANPVWEKKPQPVFQTNTARVIVFDLSRSMEIGDLTPSRLTRARFKIEDILRKQEEGQIGLVVFAGDAFTAVPLTRDADTIRALLPSLTPQMMPIQGSRADLGLLKAAELLQQAGVNQGDILLISDGAEGRLAQQAAQQIAAQGHTISVLAVGTEKGAAIPNVTDRQGNKIIVKLDRQTLQEIAKEGGGVYSLIHDNDADLRQILTSHQGEKDSAQRDNTMNNDDWKEQGPLLVLLLLPLAALAFRRGWLMSLALMLFIGIQPRPVFALEWNDLWLRADQQADKAFQKGELATASKIAQDPILRGNAEYLQGHYEQAITSFSHEKSADALYNKGNALAKLGRYDEAIDSYNQALKQLPNFTDAITNKTYVETLKKQKEEQQQQQQNKKDQNGKKPSEKGDKKTDKEAENQQQQDKPQEKQQGDGQKEEQKDKQGSSDQQDTKQPDPTTDEKEAGKQEKNKANANNKDNAFDQAAKAEEEKKDQSTEKQKEEQAAQHQPTISKQHVPTDEKSSAENEKQLKAEQLSREEKIAADQWLRRIPDNPGDLLRRKFRYQYQQRRAPEGTQGSNPW